MKGNAMAWKLPIHKADGASCVIDTKSDEK